MFLKNTKNLYILDSNIAFKVQSLDTSKLVGFLIYFEVDFDGFDLRIVMSELTDRVWSAGTQMKHNTWYSSACAYP